MEDEFETLKIHFLNNKKENREIIQYREDLPCLKIKTRYTKDENFTNKDNFNAPSNKFIRSDNNYVVSENHNKNLPLSVFKRKEKELITTVSSIESLGPLRSKSETRIKERINTSPDLLKSTLSKPILGTMLFKSPSKEEDKVLNFEFSKILNEKSLSNSNFLPFKKETLQNIQNNISELKRHLSTNENGYENTNTKINSEPLTDQGKDSHDIFNTPKSSDEEIRQIKSFYENELRMKTEIFNQNIIHERKTHQEEIKKLSIDYEQKIDVIIKKYEEGKDKMKGSDKKLGEMKDIVDYQLVYLKEMKNIQKSFEEFKIRTDEELIKSRRAKEQSQNEVNHNKLKYEKSKKEFETKENMYKKKFNKFKFKLDLLEIYTSETLKVQLADSMSEIKFLKSKIEKMEENYITYNSSENINKNKNFNIHIDNLNYLTEGNERDVRINACSEKIYYFQSREANFELIGMLCNSGKVEKLNNNYKNNLNISEVSKLNTDHSLNKLIDFKKAHQNIKDMEDSLKLMNNENESLKGKLQKLKSNMNSPHDSETDENFNLTHCINCEKSLSKQINYYYLKDDKQIVSPVSNYSKKTILGLFTNEREQNNHVTNKIDLNIPYVDVHSLKSETNGIDIEEFIEEKIVDFPLQLKR